MSSPPRVFISYSHDSEVHKDRVLALSDRLRSDGIDCRIDQYLSVPAEGWPRWMLNQVEDADFVLVLCTEIYDARFRGKAPERTGLGGKWEGAVITQELYENELRNTKFVPVLLTSADSKHIPAPLRGTNFYDLTAGEPAYEQLYRRLTNQHDTPQPELGKLRSLPPRRRNPG